MAESSFEEYGLWTSIIGGILIFLDGITALVTGNLYIWSAANPVITVG